MRLVLGLLCAVSSALLWPGSPRAADQPAAARVEVRTENLAAVGIVQADRLSIHVSRVLDNAPVRDALVTVWLRGVAHATQAETDGSYTLQTKDLELPGSAAVDFQITQGESRQDLKGTLLVAGSAVKPGEDKNSVRQLWWWVLNFAVCIGFLMLMSRRRKAAAKD